MGSVVAAGRGGSNAVLDGGVSAGNLGIKGNGGIFRYCELGFCLVREIRKEE